MSDRVKFLLEEAHLPKAWYNINADMPEPMAPVLHPGTQQPVTADDLDRFAIRTYADYAAGKLQDLPYDESEVAMALAGLPVS